jgi:hypothetical protein
MTARHNRCRTHRTPSEGIVWGCSSEVPHRFRPWRCFYPWAPRPLARRTPRRLPVRRHRTRGSTRRRRWHRPSRQKRAERCIAPGPYAAFTLRMVPDSELTVQLAPSPNQAPCRVVEFTTSCSSRSSRPPGMSARGGLSARGWASACARAVVEVVPACRRHKSADRRYSKQGFRSRSRSCSRRLRQHRPPRRKGRRSRPPRCKGPCTYRSGRAGTT